MRKRFAKRWRKTALRMGAVIETKGAVIEYAEGKLYGLSKRECGFGLIAEYKGFRYHICGSDELETYRLLVQCLEDDEINQTLADT